MSDSGSEKGLYPESIYIPTRESNDSRSSFERERVRASIDGGVEGITEERLIKAVMLVEDAIAGRKYSSKDDVESMRRHIWYHHWIVQTVIQSVVLLHMALAFFEVPASIPMFKSKDSIIIVTGMIEMIILIFYAVEMVFKRTFLDVKNDSFLHNKNYWVNWACIVLTMIDDVIGMILRTKYFRWSRFLRPLFVIYNFRSVRNYFKNLKNTLPDIAHVFAVLFGLILFYVLTVDVLLGHSRDPSFPNTFRAFISLYITSTTANFPDIMVFSVNNVSPWFSLLFVSYAILVTKIMLSLFTAVVYNRYQYHISKDVEKIRKTRKAKLTAAFAALDVHRTGILHIEEWSLLISNLRPHYTDDKIRLLFRIIDENGSNDIRIREFRRIVSLLRLSITTQSGSGGDNHIARRFPGAYKTRAYFFLRKIVLSKAFGWAMDLVVLASAVSIIAFREWNFTLTFRTSVESVLLAMYTGEALLKLFVLGTGEFWASHWNKFDAVLIITSMIATFITLLPGLSSQIVVRVVLLFRIVRLFRFGRTSKNVKSLYMTMWRLIPTFIMHGLALLVVFFWFGEVGMAIWAGKIYPGNPLLDGSGFAANGFWNVGNFNSFGNSLLTLTALLIQNNWHVIVDAHERVSNPAAWLFFIFFNISTAVVIINILVAFILDGFITQWKVVQLQIKTKIQDRIEQLAREGAAKQIAEAQTEDAPVNDEQVELDGENALDKMEKFLGEEEKGGENIIWTATDTSFRVDPLEFAEEDEDEDE